MPLQLPGEMLDQIFIAPKGRKVLRIWVGQPFWPGREVVGKVDENAEVCPPVSGMLGGQENKVLFKGGARKSHGSRPEGPVFLMCLEPAIAWHQNKKTPQILGMIVPQAQP